MTGKELHEWMDKLDAMSQEDLARLQRFAPVGHPIFNTENDTLYAYFQMKFRGLTPELSKRIGLEERTKLEESGMYIIVTEDSMEGVTMFGPYEDIDIASAIAEAHFTDGEYEIHPTFNL